MKKSRLLMMSLLLIAFTIPVMEKLQAQDCEPVTRPQLRSMLVQLGYAVNDLETAPGKEKYSIKTTVDGLDIPIGLELSGNSKYIWLTVNLGKAPSDTSSKYTSLIKENSRTQPSLFYVTNSGLLMMGLPVDNRGLTNALLRERIESISKHVANTEDIWDN